MVPALHNFTMSLITPTCKAQVHLCHTYAMPMGPSRALPMTLGGKSSPFEAAHHKRTGCPLFSFLANFAHMAAPLMSPGLM